MAAVTGQRTTLNVNQTSRKIDMVEKIKLLQGDPAPLTILAGELPSAVAINPKFQWQEDDLNPRFDQVDGAHLLSATAILVDNGDYFRPNVLIKVPRTGEMIRVQEVVSNTLTVVRGVGSTAAALNDNEPILIGGTAFAEGTLSPDAQTRNATDVYNYTGILKTSIEITGTQNATKQITDADWAYQQNKQGIEHRRDLEYQYWHGSPSETTVSGKPIRTSGGVFNYATQNITAAGGTLTEAAFFAALVDIFRYGNDVKFGFASPFVISVLNGYARSNIQVIQSEITTKYGVKIFEYITPFGTLRLIKNVNFEGTTLKGYLSILDMAALRRRYMEGRDTHIETNIQENDRDGRKDQYLTETGLEFGEPKKHGLITGITG